MQNSNRLLAQGACSKFPIGQTRLSRTACHCTETGCLLPRKTAASIPFLIPNRPLEPKAASFCHPSFTRPGAHLCSPPGTPMPPGGRTCTRPGDFPNGINRGKRKQTPAGCRQKRYKIVHFIKYYSPPCLISCKKALILKPLTPLFPA